MKSSQTVIVTESNEYNKPCLYFVDFNNYEGLIFLLLMLYIMKAQSYAYFYLFKEHKYWIL